MSPKKPTAKPRRRTSKKPRKGALATRRLALSVGTKLALWPFSGVLKVIEIQDGGPSQFAVHLRRHGVVFKPDRVQWVNLDARGRTVVFKDNVWPFVEPPQEICIPAHGNSGIFTVYMGAELGGYDYGILPPEPTSPGEPQIVVDP